MTDTKQTSDLDQKIEDALREAYEAGYSAACNLLSGMFDRADMDDAAMMTRAAWLSRSIVLKDKELRK